MSTTEPALVCLGAMIGIGIVIMAILYLKSLL